jgi:hypothetical protein
MEDAHGQSKPMVQATHVDKGQKSVGKYLRQLFADNLLIF